jgi:DNA polymerase-3 subunit delta
MYLVFGEQELLVNKMVDKLAKSELDVIDDFNLVVFDSYKAPLYEIVNDASTLPFMAEKKVLVVKNSYFLTTEIPKLEFEQSFNELEEYLENQNGDVTVIFSVVASKLDDKRPLVKKIKEKSKIYALDNVSKKDLPRVVRQMFDKQEMSITNDALSEFISRCGEDMYLINTEVEKLSCYKKEIDIKDINLMISKKLEDNVFEMIDGMFSKKLDKVFSIYYDLKVNNNEPLTLISLIASQVRFMYQVMVLKDKGYSENNIANELSCHPYRAKLALEKVYHLNKMDLTDLLEQLSNLDIKIKSGEIDRFVGFELFLLNACK